ncbi:hypothetical protein [Hymenobacter latericus]|uniref:hypothetical protein n=1 Tax=Hymenobacter sp. YIM 151858-1 TaxID=2987688 RepID=UPI0022278CC9|nr:hypothetical protein [Hymenobacter sp. YIM 151858-1]UYZ57665.1 hypothetical protein OIS50_11350 [Hymenobacter sp. YIM 151858-1]
MLKQLLCTLALSGLAATGFAQAPAAPAAAPGPAAYSRTDTLEALSAMFTMKRRGGHLPLTLAMPGVALMSTKQREYDVYSGSWVETAPSGGAVAAGVLLMGGGLAYLLVRNSTYNLGTLQQLQINYDAGQPLPERYRRELRPRHFAKAAKWRAKRERRNR